MKGTTVAIALLTFMCLLLTSFIIVRPAAPEPEELIIDNCHLAMDWGDKHALYLMTDAIDLIMAEDSDCISQADKQHACDSLFTFIEGSHDLVSVEIQHYVVRMILHVDYQGQAGIDFGMCALAKEIINDNL